MCILFIARRKRADYPLIIAANRDEFYQRPTAPSAFWKHHPHMLAGQDLEASGTWMGVTRQGKIAALTNVRAPSEMKTDVNSRGELVANWLQQPLADHQNNSLVAIDEYLQSLHLSRNQYNGYNLLFGDVAHLCVYNNVNDTTHGVEQGVFGLSNADIVTPWPKVTQGVTALNQYVDAQAKIDCEDLFALLKQDTKAQDQALPDTGIGYEWEKALSSIFIQTPKYGTRTSTLLLLDANNVLTWKERSFSDTGLATQTREFSFQI
ncbi:MAG TPA: NRDE family protein [Cytophagales bacterium]|nr:NRDE family protein [Cytophagales bacterium]